MIENLFLLVLALFVLAFIALLWLRQGLVNELREAQAREVVLYADFQKRRDTVPYLLESTREGDTSDAWRKLVQARSSFQQSTSLQSELEFERLLHAYLSNAKQRTLSFLEAKKDIEDLSELIENQKKDRDDAIARFNERRKQFPYSLASAIFGFRPLA